jgi:glycosyltransferase involved in cell wall biosynthesis
VSEVAGLVSVIIPTYNRAELVVEAIGSARAQTYPQVEIIVVDDGSTDATADRLGMFEDVSFISQAHAGPGAARNRGLAVARGQFIASLDSDDLWNEDFLARSVGSLATDDLDLVFSNFARPSLDPSYLDEYKAVGRLASLDTDTHGEWFVLNPAQVREMFLVGCPAPSSSMLLRRSSMPSAWNEDMEIADDWYLLLEMAVGGECRAAFNMMRLWTKRIDGKNRFDGQTNGSLLPQLWLQDHARCRRDFAARLSQRERVRWAITEWRARAKLARLQLRREHAL